MDWSTFLRIAHITGTALGVGASTLLEIYFIKSLKEKQNSSQQEAIQTCVTVIRIGLIILAFSGLGLLILWRLNMLGSDVFFSPRFLAKMSIVLVLIFVAQLMSFGILKPQIGGTVSTASWYAAMILGIWRSVKLSYPAILVLYILFVILVYLLILYLRNRALAKK